MGAILIKISFIVPVYNAEDFLHDCLNSILNQSLNEIEVICIDDGSSDNSLEIIKDFSGVDDRIKVYSNEKNKGAGFTRNIGLKHAKGEFISFVDADDWIEEDFSEKLYAHAKYTDSDLVLFNSIQHQDNNLVERVYFPNNSFNEDYHDFVFNYEFNKNLVLNSFFVIWSKFYKRSFIQNFKFPDLSLFEDVLFHISSVLFAKKITYFPDFLYHYRRINAFSEQNFKVKSDKVFLLLDIFDDIKDFLIKNNFMGEFKVNFLNFILTESQNNLLKLDSDIKFIFFEKVKSLINSLNIDDNDLKNIPFYNYQFYIHVLNSSNYIDYEDFNDFNDESYDELLLEEISEKNQIISELKSQLALLQEENSILLRLQNDYLYNMDFIVNMHDEAFKLDLFDYSYYVNHEGYSGNIDPFIHYIYRGFKDGLSPSSKFNSNFYLDNHPLIKKFGINPLAHFIYGDNKCHCDSLTSWEKFRLDFDIKNFESNYNINTDFRIVISLSVSIYEINDIKYTLYSILNQSVKPSYIILWVYESDFPNKERDLPEDLLFLTRFGIEIRWYDHSYPLINLINIFKEFSNDLIINAPNNLFFDKNWLKRLYDCHISNPNEIISNYAKRLYSVDVENKIVCDDFNDSIQELDSSFLNVISDSFTTLYPPNSLDELVFDFELFKKLSISDNIWIWAMAVKKGTKINFIGDMFSFKYIFINDNQIEDYENDISIVLNYFSDIKEKLLNY